jgi:hypothetical protein
MLDETLTKEEIIAIIDSVPLGYSTVDEHIKLEKFADAISLKILQAKTGEVKIPRD